MTKRLCLPRGGLVLALWGSSCGEPAEPCPRDQVQLKVSNCGSLDPSCELGRRLTIGCQMDLAAVCARTGEALQLKSKNPKILDLRQQGSVYTATGLGDDMVGFSAFAASAPDVVLEEWAVRVTDARRIGYNERSGDYGSFAANQDANHEGTFVVNQGLRTFRLYYDLVGVDGMRMLGRQCIGESHNSPLFAAREPQGNFVLTVPDPGTFDGFEVAYNVNTQVRFRTLIVVP